MALVVLPSQSPRPCPRTSPLGAARRTGWANLLHQPSALRPARADPVLDLEVLKSLNTENEEAWKMLDNITALGFNLENDEDQALPGTLPNLSLHSPQDTLVEDEEKDSSPFIKPFHKWMKTLHRRANRPTARDGDGQVVALPDYFMQKERSHGRRKSSTGSSFGFVAAVRSASVSLASASVITRPRQYTARSSLHTKTDRSSRASMSTPRVSEDSTCLDRTMSVDREVTERLLQRRRILEELITTEENYIGDVKFLMNVYVTLLASLPTQHHGLRSSINRNLTDIVELHEEILGELHRVVPNSEYTQPELVLVAPLQLLSKRHQRWHSLDSVPEDNKAKVWLQGVPSVIAEPDVAAEVAHVFGKRTNRFFVYEEYGAKYETMIKDVATTHRTLPQWETYQKGLEALAASLSSSNHHLDHSKKSLTIGDLLVKPIQRICRYPLLFAELLKYTPVCDCPHAHMEIEDVLIRLREATTEINRATDDPGMKLTMEQTWMLQDRLVFPNQKLDAASKTQVRSFGQIRLCGALHVCWQTTKGVHGQYMASLLYKDCLCLATVGRFDQTYTVQACIGLDSIKVEEADNGRGLQCHTAPFSWKLVFECDHQLYEIIMTACSSREEAEWRGRLSRSEAAEISTPSRPVFYSSLYLNMKSLGTVFGKPGTVARRLSIHRATTVGPKSAMCQVILKNTSAVKDTQSASSGAAINRSQSLLTTNSRIPVLAPSRSDRARLEALLADVWSRKTLPFPGITSRSRSEQLVRSSATSMMRKLSVASITGSLAKRSATTSIWINDDVLAHGKHSNDAFNDVDNDTSTPCLGTADLTDNSQSKTRLPIIRDETNRSSSAGAASLRSTSGTTSRGTVKRLKVTRRESDWSEESRISTPPLRSSSPNSVQQKRPNAFPSPKSPLCSTEKVETFQGWENARTREESLKSTKSSSKWSRVSAINRGFVASGIRNLFR